MREEYGNEHNIMLGRMGEDIACDHLIKNGYSIVARNTHVSKNEIDIIAEDKDFFVFVEVKTRSVLYENSSYYGSPGRAVNYKKRTNTVAAARAYLATHYTKKQPRIDVIEVCMRDKGGNSVCPQLLTVNHIRDAFDSRGRKH